MKNILCSITTVIERPDKREQIIKLLHSIYKYEHNLNKLLGSNWRKILLPYTKDLNDFKTGGNDSEKLGGNLRRFKIGKKKVKNKPKLLNGR